MTAELIPAATRNDDVFLPDDEKTRTLLPIALKVDVDGAESHVSTNRIEALPAFVRIREPAPGIVIVSVGPIK